jgi:uncharacterized protein (DUF433 family)
MNTITFSEQTYNTLAVQAAKMKCTPDELAEQIIAGHFAPPHPYLEFVRGASGVMRPVFKGTRLAIHHVVGYLQLGETPETIIKEVYPHLSLSAIYDALSYYHEHKAEIDQERAENTEEASQKYLREKLGEEKYYKITGQKP